MLQKVSKDVMEHIFKIYKKYDAAIRATHNSDESF